MNHAHDDVGRRRGEAHREEDPRKVRLVVSGKECTCQVKVFFFSSEVVSCDIAR